MSELDGGSLYLVWSPHPLYHNLVIHLVSVANLVYMCIYEQYFCVRVSVWWQWYMRVCV